MNEHKAGVALGPYLVESSDGEHDIFSDDGSLIAEVMDTEDPDVDEATAHLLASAWDMRDAIKKAINFIKEGEDGLARDLLKATLRKTEPIESAHGRADDGGKTPGEAGGTSR
jgi:hypothetical protein